MRKLSFKQLTFFVCMVLLAAGFTVTAQQEQVSLCHMIGSYDFGFDSGPIPYGTEISVGQNAVASHEQHGDRLTYALRTMSSTGQTVCISDRDADGVGDDEDRFPDDPTRQVDTDRDGLADDEDDCPTVAGSRSNGGCPYDVDGDGIEDSDDACPTEPGPVENQGCPAEDSDGDGVADHEDECPNVAGSAENAGCPAEDSDRDGLVGEQDNCPTEWGLAEDNGCPADNDGDGVANASDFCPETPDLSPYVNAETYVDSNGCIYIEGENLSHANWGDLSSRNMQGADFISTNMQEIYAPNMNFVASYWNNVIARGADFSNSDLSGGTRFENTDLTDANFSGSNLFGAVIDGTNSAINANFTNATLSRSQLDNLNLSGANLTGASLAQADLWGANLTGANLTNANLQGADLTGANLTDVIWSNTTCPDGTLSDNNGGFCNP
jgi:uncharacterized protein YjbI with pentapeptide repeats